MNRRTVGWITGVAAATVAGIGLGAGVVLAQDDRNDDRNEDKAELAAFGGAKLKLVDAIAIAERETGGQALEASFDLERGNAVYEVDVVAADNARRELSIDAATGAVRRNAADRSDLVDLD